ncbi:MAG: PKD repeat protein, partial [Planctomycetota bacterium]
MKSPLISIQDFASNHSLAVNWLNSEIIRLSRCLLVIALLAAGVSAQVIIDFAATPITGSQPLVVSFEATVTGGTPSAYFWNFGDGNFGASQNPSHVYLAQQTTSYTVTLVVFTDNGMGNEIKTDFITVVPGVVPVGFFETAVSGTNPLSVSFTGFSNVFPVDSWQWDFGDGQTSSLQSPTHVFTAATLTSFTVSLTIEFGGQFETITKTDLVTVTPAIFTVDFSESIVSGANPLSVSFSDLTDISPITSRLWEFGDGQTSTQPNPTHVYSVATTTSFTVSLTIELGAQIQSLTKTNLIVVDPAALVVDFDVDNSNGDPGLIVQFQNLSSGMNVETWNWDFGDGNISTQQNPTNTYIFPGDYDVTLTAFIGVQEATLSKQSFITVNQVPQPAADFLVSAPTGNHPLTVDFINLSTGSLVTGYLWDFGDGTTSAQTDPTHTYFVTEETSFDVSLTIFTVLGNDILTVADQITVFFPFASHTVGATASAARVLKTADMNGDGALDVIVGTDGDDSVSWYENFNALGSFGPSQPIATNTPNPISIDIA